MNRRNLRFLLVGVALPALVMLGVGTARAHGPTGQNPSDAFTRLFTIVFLMAIPIFLLVQGLLIFAVVRYRRRSKDEAPKQVHGNHTLEWTWTLGSFAIVGILFLLNAGILAADDPPPSDAMVIEVTGRQFFWEFYYPDADVLSVNELKLPAGRSVRLDITSADVQHSFWVPEWGGKVDAIPGRVNTLWFDLHDPASYTVRCAEYCGLSHYEMLADVEVVPAEAFDRWVDERIAERNRFEPVGIDTETALPEGDPLRGEEWFIELGCGGCHSLDGSGGPQGPTLQGIGEAAATRVEGYTAGQYLRESILLPCEHLAGDYRCFMPQEYGERLELQNLADLIAYLMAQ